MPDEREQVRITRHVDLCDGSTVYELTDTHRGSRARKSVWDISPEEEVAIFDYSAAEGWCRGRIFWALHIVDGRASALGRTAQPHRAPAIIARTRGQYPVIHGYPADPILNNQDRPPEEVASHWMPIVGKRTAKRLVAGQVR